MFILKKGHQPGVYVTLRALFLVMPPTLKKWGHIGFGLSVCIASVTNGLNCA